MAWHILGEEAVNIVSRWRGLDDGSVRCMDRILRVIMPSYYYGWD